MTMMRFLCSTFIVLAAILLCGCEKEPLPSQTAVFEADATVSQETQSSPVETEANGSLESSFDQLGLCFSYPQGYTQIPDTLEIVAPDLPGTDLRALFWLEMSDPDNRSTEEIADQELANANGVNADRWTVTLDGEEAVVLDGMPGQDLQRRVYVVHQQTLYILAFMPTRSENQVANDQMETLFAAITGSWSWSPCSDGE